MLSRIGVPWGVDTHGTNPGGQPPTLYHGSKAISHTPPLSSNTNAPRDKIQT